ncbi:hypothetical protein LWX67_000015 [Salmonella enterica]|nr:hypothetical protein [Salmonella enterica]KSB54782.1 hypothetical protein LFZ1_13265 [Salmonella enterica subsp. enterica serovar Rubislaw str. SA20030553]EIC7588734.1 hypothetical protein [Salmonella enterica]EIR4015199.1 hypothetical protein [Salmonella enterica]ELL3045074.1 hypothetical protein [Salmonella enterica]
MGQKFFDMHESSRLNMSFKCSGAFNIIYIMRTNGKDGGIWRSATVTWSGHIFTVMPALLYHHWRSCKQLCKADGRAGSSPVTDGKSSAMTQDG